MAYINLLPWREQHRQQKKQQYLALLIAVALVVGAIFWFIGQLIDQQIENQRQRNQFLQQKILVLDAQIEQIKKIKEAKAAIEQRMTLIEQLQKSRNVSPIVFDELAKIVPDGIAFVAMRRIGNHIEIEGISDSNNYLSDFMRAIEESSVFGIGELSSVKADTQAPKAVSTFTLKFGIHPSIAPTVVVEGSEVTQ